MDGTERVAVIGLGYIGLPTAAVLAGRGLSVLGVDVNGGVVETINRGEIHIEEADLGGLVHQVVSAGRLSAATQLEPADVFIIAVPTPFGEGNEPDLSHVAAAAKMLAPVLKGGDLVILESTLPVGATEDFVKQLAEARPDLGFPERGGEAAEIRVAHCPERVLPGQILHEILTNDRVIGGVTPACTAAAADFYRFFVKGECHLTDARTAELVKLSENAFRDVNIAFANELSLVADRLDIDVWELIHLTNRHPRVSILQPGPGVGGHCIAVDPWFIVHSAPDEARLIRTAREVNDGKPKFVAQQVLEAARDVAEPVIACLGLAFKADIDDLRESPAVEVVRRLAEAKPGRIIAVEPHIAELPKELSGLGVELADLEAALEAANVVVGLVDHRLFASLASADLSGKKMIDTRGMLR